MTSQSYILIALVAFAIIVIALIAQKKQEQETSGDDYGPREGDDIERQQKTRAILTVLGGLFVAGGLLAYYLFRHKVAGPSSNSSSEDGSIVAFIPIWFAAMIPIFASKKKKGELKHKQRKMLIILLALTILFVLGTFFFTFFK